jgi:hypothetical protein
MRDFVVVVVVVVVGAVDAVDASTSPIAAGVVIAVADAATAVAVVR